MYNKDARAYIQKLIRIRNRLNFAGQSKRPTLPLAENIDFLRRHLEAYSYSDDSKMAKFFKNNQIKIYSLIPGQNCSAHKGLVKQFYELLNISNQILQPTHA